jgi:hypothetical protein
MARPYHIRKNAAGEFIPPMHAPKCDVCGRPAIGQIERMDQGVFNVLCGKCWPADDEGGQVFDYFEFITEDDI